MYEENIYRVYVNFGQSLKEGIEFMIINLSPVKSDTSDGFFSLFSTYEKTNQSNMLRTSTKISICMISILFVLCFSLKLKI